MSWMGSRPRSTGMLEILMTYYNSCSASAARSPSIRSTRVRALSSSTDQSHPSVGCRPCSSSFANIASHTSRSISCWRKRIWHSSSVRSRSVSCLHRELEACAWVKKSRSMASAWALLASHSVRTSPSTHKGCQPFLPHDDGTFLAI
jgi:hypothetical protein